MNRYSYDELLAAVNSAPTQENINALGEWFNSYGMDYWNGEYFDADGLRIYPVLKEFDEDEYELVGYELR